MCELLCTVIITVKKGIIEFIVYIMHDVSHEILILDTVYDFQLFTSYPDIAMILNRNNIISLVLRVFKCVPLNSGCFFTIRTPFFIHFLM